MKFWSYTEELKQEETETFDAIKKCLYSGQLILGEEVRKFENDFAKYSGCKYGIGVNSATDALFLALKAMDIGPGDEVVSVSNTAVPTISAIAATGATPVFADICPETYLIDPSHLESKINKKTKCVLPVHLFGQCANMTRIKQISNHYNIPVLEDCAQSHGALQHNLPCGSFGDISAYSFYPTKVLGTYGDAGMICTSNASLAERSKRLRYYGMDETYYAEEHGYNSRLDELQAAILNVKFKRLSVYIENRQKIARHYDKYLHNTSLVLPKTSPGNEHSYYMYVVRHAKRDRILSYLKENGVNLSIAYPWPIHTMRGFKYLGYKDTDLPHTEKAANEIFSLPVYPTFSLKDQEKLIALIVKALSTL